MATLGRFLKQKQQQQAVEEPAPPAPPLKNPRAIGRNLMIGGGLATAAAIPAVNYGFAKEKLLPLVMGSSLSKIGRAALLLGGGYALANMAAKRRKQQGGYTY
jgi:hypothetical protein